jgi:hypothetical protein
MSFTAREARTGKIVTLSVIEAAVRSAWSLETCDPVDVPLWHSGNPARGQCGVTALVLQDLLGGDLLVAEVEYADGGRQGVHYWNRLAGGIEVDLTREQFTDGERIGAPSVAPRPPGGRPARCADQYDLLRNRVLAAV